MHCLFSIYPVLLISLFGLHLALFNKKCFQYGKISNFISVQLNINYAMYVLNFLHVEQWYIFEVFNHIYNAMFKYNVIYFIGRII